MLCFRFELTIKSSVVWSSIRFSQKMSPQSLYFSFLAILFDSPTSQPYPHSNPSTFCPLPCNFLHLRLFYFLVGLFIHSEHCSFSIFLLMTFSTLYIPPLSIWFSPESFPIFHFHHELRTRLLVVCWGIFYIPFHNSITFSRLILFRNLFALIVFQAHPWVQAQKIVLFLPLL